jgi:hypothetical protein
MILVTTFYRPLAFYSGNLQVGGDYDRGIKNHSSIFAGNS